MDCAAGQGSQTCGAAAASDFLNAQSGMAGQRQAWDLATTQRSRTSHSTTGKTITARDRGLRPSLLTKMPSPDLVTRQGPSRTGSYRRPSAMISCSSGASPPTLHSRPQGARGGGEGALRCSHEETGPPRDPRGPCRRLHGSRGRRCPRSCPLPLGARASCMRSASPPQHTGRRGRTPCQCCNSAARKLLHAACSNRSHVAASALNRPPTSMSTTPLRVPGKERCPAVPRGLRSRCAFFRALSCKRAWFHKATWRVARVPATRSEGAMTYRCHPGWRKLLRQPEGRLQMLGGPGAPQWEYSAGCGGLALCLRPARYRARGRRHRATCKGLCKHRIAGRRAIVARAVGWTAGHPAWAGGTPIASKELVQGLSACAGAEAELVGQAGLLERGGKLLR